MMAEYIDRDSIYATLADEHPFGWTNDDLAELFRQAKTADVAPVRHGKWTSIGYDCGENEYQCSECRRTEWRGSADDMKFCMFCGAKMDLNNER